MGVCCEAVSFSAQREAAAPTASTAAVAQASMQSGQADSEARHILNSS